MSRRKLLLSESIEREAKSAGEIIACRYVLDGDTSSVMVMDDELEWLVDAIDHAVAAAARHASKPILAIEAAAKEARKP